MLSHVKKANYQDVRQEVQKALEEGAVVVGKLVVVVYLLGSCLSLDFL